ncbi:uncharacterized protein LOC105276068 isoform X2 [Ooceraea biroi]|uniref:uncharacterized protein LOC105276068 isoform X2 n=1 Tax=Ooceraea biroi TaxID=2015173 RepID=UPI0009715AD4|nr:uncharacterized protein LOC105276068 isoform X2 [Ooceraea biroi]
MNVGGDIGQLSYKELQALALRYHVPGNIKKKVLVKVLQAARSGDEAEFSRLLQELRKNRKRKTRKSKDSKLGITSTPLHSPDYIMADDDYYCQQQPQQQPQQQASYQWIGAEEEIVSKDDDNKIPHYEEFKQFLLKRIQREFQTCDANNNNQVQDLSIVDLRTMPMSPGLQTIPIDEPSYPKAGLIDPGDPLAIATDRGDYQVLKEPEGSPQGSFLLKRMLQAPVGANLGEIASSLFWASNLLDNSDTLTAESENNDTEDQLVANANEYYGLLKNNKGEFLLNEASLMPPQDPGILTSNDQYNRFPSDVDNRQNPYQNWTITSVMEVPVSDLPSSKVFHTIYYNNNTDPATVTAANANNDLGYQYQTDPACNDNQNYLNFDAQDINYATGTDTITSQPNDIYYLQNFSKHSSQTEVAYLHNADTFGHSNAQQNIYPNDQQYQYFYPRLTQETNNPLNERLEQQQSNAVAGMDNCVNQEIGARNLQRPANGTVDPFWPKWTTQASNNLENILNYHVTKQVDYSKLSQTSCVYCYAAPIVSQRSTLTNSSCSSEHKYTAEQRQHSFSPYWMLYNDASQGMRMTNTASNLLEQPATMTAHPINIFANDELKETVNDTSEAAINDVWMNQYEPVTIGDDMNVQVSDSLFCNVTANHIDDILDTSDMKT